MYKTRTFVAVLIGSLLLQGCAYFVPSAIKREVSLVRTDVEVCGVEAKALREKADQHRKAAEDAIAAGNKDVAIEELRQADELSEQATEKVLRSYNRVTPHVVNTDNYMQHRDAQGNL